SSPIALGASRGIEGFVFVAAGAPGFVANSILLAEFNTGKVSSFALDTNSDPIVASENTFITGMTRVLGAAVDPATGDFLFSTFDGATSANNKIFLVQPVPEAGAALQMALMALTSLSTVVFLKRKHVL